MKLLIIYLFLIFSNFPLIKAEGIQNFNSDKQTIENNIDSKKIHIHIVQKGETILSISEFYSVSKESIIELNNLNDENYIFIGQNLKVMSSNNPNFVNPNEIENSASNQKNYHIILAGDTLTDISDKYGISISNLIKINQLDNPDSLRIGSKLILRENNLKEIESEEEIISLNIYGPLTIKSMKLEIIRGRNILKATHKNGKDLIISINCPKNEIDVRTEGQRWQGWMPANKDFEKQLIKDYCERIKLISVN